MTPVVVGVDLSLTSTGYSTGHTTEQISKPKWVHELPAELDRLRWMRNEVALRVTRDRPDLVVVEVPAYSSTSGHATARGGLFWMLLDQLAGCELPVAPVITTCLKKYATGKGTAGKDDVIREVKGRFPWFAGKNDEADALVLAAMGYDHLGEPLVKMPATHRAALDKVAWPDLAGAR